MRDGPEVLVYILTNENGFEAAVAEFGATLISLHVPDGDRRQANVVLGYDSLDAYVDDAAYMGATIGRYANRIHRGTFSMSGIDYTLTRNEGRNQLHGGYRGFNKAHWSSEAKPSTNSILLRHLSRDGEEGYPGNLSVEVRYTLTSADEIRIDYLAMSDRETVVNLTNHSYFNLHGSGDILQHELILAADAFLPIDEDFIPTGELRSVEGTPFDFRNPAAIGARIGSDDEQLKIAGGYDHNWILNHAAPGELRFAAQLHDPVSGRQLKVWTTEPGIQFYSGNQLKPNLSDPRARTDGPRSGLCLETQHFPDSPHHPQFPSVILKPGTEFRSTTVYKFNAA